MAQKQNEHTTVQTIGAAMAGVVVGAAAGAAAVIATDPKKRAKVLKEAKKVGNIVIDKFDELKENAISETKKLHDRVEESLDK